MSDHVELSGLSIKDLRQLAGEHHIQNRSRMGRNGLIQALTSVLAGAVQQGAPAAEVPAGTIEEAAPVTQDATMDAAVEAPATAAPETTDTGTEDDGTTEDALPPPLASAPASEPEVLDAAAVAGLVPGAPGQPGEGGGRRRRRRRRRGGRNRDRGESASLHAGMGIDAGDDGDDEGDDGDDAPDGGTAPNAVAPVDHAAAGEAPVPAAPETPSAERQPQPQQQGRPPQQPQQQGRPQDPRPPRPRVDGPQRHMPSVLDRLCTFTRGILELCDPSTPSWAQARLSELLAEAGLVPVPCQGQPHPDFHQVVGTVVAKDIPTGQIAVVEAPGFALRGDRGDLFPQRRAQVRLSGERDERTQPLPPPAPRSDIPRPSVVPAPSVIPTPVVAVTPRSEAPAPRPAPVMAEPEPLGTAAPVAATAPRMQPAPAPRQDRPAPPPGRDPLRTHTREIPSESPKLPLASQDPVELAQRAKAEPFRPLGLNEQILADVAAIGWNEPSPIQVQAIPVALAGKDMIGQAQTGTGKTGAFVLPILQKLYAIEDQDRRPVALVLCPTRELAKQVYAEFNRMAGSSGARATVIYGGTPMDEQFRAIERCPHVIIGTPGRIIDHMKRRSLDFSRLAMVVLDEADQMLDIGFWPDVQYIITHTPPNRQILLFSATFPDPIRVMAEKHMRTPEHVRIAPKVVTVDQVDQKYIAIPRERKNELLAHFIDTQKPDSMLVFCRTRHQTDRVAEVLKRKNYSAGAIHGDLPQTKREKILAQFRAGELKSLIATNVAARGLDIPIVSHVVNYDIPEMPEEYVHRIGRTARNGAPGVARTFITPEDGQFLLEIEKHIGLLLEEEQVDGFTPDQATTEVKRTIADAPVAGARLIKPLAGGIRLGRRRR